MHPAASTASSPPVTRTKIFTNLVALLVLLFAVGGDCSSTTSSAAASSSSSSSAASSESGSSQALMKCKGDFCTRVPSYLNAAVQSRVNAPAIGAAAIRLLDEDADSNAYMESSSASKTSSSSFEVLFEGWFGHFTYNTTRPTNSVERARVGA